MDSREVAAKIPSIFDIPCYTHLISSPSTSHYTYTHYRFVTSPMGSLNSTGMACYPPMIMPVLRESNLILLDSASHPLCETSHYYFRYSLWALINLWDISSYACLPMGFLSCSLGSLRVTKWYSLTRSKAHPSLCGIFTSLLFILPLFRVGSTLDSFSHLDEQNLVIDHIAHICVFGFSLLKY